MAWERGWRQGCVSAHLAGGDCAFVWHRTQPFVLPQGSEGPLFAQLTSHEPVQA